MSRIGGDSGQAARLRLAARPGGRRLGIDPQHVVPGTGRLRGAAAVRAGDVHQELRVQWQPRGELSGRDGPMETPVVRQ